MAAKSNDNQLLRSAFDMAYEAPGLIRRFYRRVPRGARKIAVSIVLAVLTFAVTTTLAGRVLQTIEWANRPALDTYLEAPYALNERGLPVLDVTLYTDRGIPIVRQAEYNAVEADLIAAAQPATTDDTDQPVEAPAVEFTEAEVLNALMQREDWVWDAESYFVVLPPLDGYERRFTDDTTLHPSINCMFIMDAETGTGCGMTYAPFMVEVATYRDAAGDDYRVAAHVYADGDEAYQAINEVYRTSRSAGTVGNFSLRASDEQNYYYAFANSNVVFAWRRDNWVFMVSGPQMDQVEDLIKALPY